MTLLLQPTNIVAIAIHIWCPSGDRLHHSLDI
jgi:hypothetical protein